MFVGIGRISYSSITNRSVYNKYWTTAVSRFDRDREVPGSKPAVRSSKPQKPQSSLVMQAKLTENNRMKANIPSFDHGTLKAEPVRRNGRAVRLGIEGFRVRNSLVSSGFSFRVENKSELLGGRVEMLNGPNPHHCSPIGRAPIHLSVKTLHRSLH